MTRNDLNFDNGAFWDHRYSENPLLGSGIGSRGENLRHKRKIIEYFIQSIAPDTILDVGCGDHEVLKDIKEIPGYTGIDVSSVVIEKNIIRFPHRRFECLDFVSCYNLKALISDVVLCMEVLIHQHKREEYEIFVKNIVAATKNSGLVSAYIFDPRPFIASDIIAWHEPITDTLYRAGAKDVAVEGRSLESECLAFVSFRT